jgi:transposase
VLRLASIDRKPLADVELGCIPDSEVWMRPPSVFVRELLPEDGIRLKRLSRKAASEAKRERALIVWASATRMPASQIATLVGSDESHVRKVIHAFNERGFSSLDPEQRGGRPRRITDEQRARIVAVAGARPDTLGVPATRWSLKRLARYLRERQIVEVSPAHLGRILAATGLSFQRTRTWKASPDPDYEAKAARVIALYKQAPNDGVVISFDQMGPISLRPHAGSGWAKRKRPERQRATFNRRHGTRYVFGAYDVHADRLRPRRRGSDNLAFMRQIRACYPKRLRIYWIQDNLSANWTPDIQAFAAANNMELVATPTYASYLNPRRVPLPADQRVRRQELRLPGLGRLQLRPGPPHHRPQRRPPRPARARTRTPTPDRRLTHADSGENFRDGALEASTLLPRATSRATGEQTFVSVSTASVPRSSLSWKGDVVLSKMPEPDHPIVASVVGFEDLPLGSKGAGESSSVGATGPKAKPSGGTPTRSCSARATSSARAPTRSARCSSAEIAIGSSPNRCDQEA